MLRNYIKELIDCLLAFYLWLEAQQYRNVGTRHYDLLPTMTHVENDNIETNHLLRNCCTIGFLGSSVD